MHSRRSPSNIAICHALTQSAQVAVHACSFQVSPAAELQILPAGKFAARDGRPGDQFPFKSWSLDDARGRAIAKSLNSQATDFLVDYEHQTLDTAASGKPAPAAAWCKSFEWRDGSGLYATDVQWTAKARDLIEAKEYRYFSPVFSFDKKTGAVLSLLHGAITNFPALDGLQELAQRAAARFFGDAAALSANVSPRTEQSMNPLLKLILAALGLPETTAEENAVAAVTALKVKADGAEAQIVALKSSAARVPELETEIAALRSGGTSSVAAMRALQDEVAQLRTRLNESALSDAITVALKAGKLLPAQEKWARELGSRDMASLTEYLNGAPAVAALSGQRQAADPNKAGTVEGMTDEDLAICKHLGVSPEEFKKSKTALGV